LVILLASPEAIKPLTTIVVDPTIPNLANAVVGAEAGVEAVIKVLIEATPEAEAEAGAEAVIEDVTEAGIKTEDLDLRTAIHDARIPESDASFVRNVAIWLEIVLPLKSCESSANYRRIRPSKALLSLQEWLASPI